MSSPPTDEALPLVRVGTSGWIYRHWRGPVYPAGVPGHDWLRFIAARQGAVEVNATFYGSLRPATFARWQVEVAEWADGPAGFRIAIKGSRFITHVRRLRQPEQGLANFFATGPLLLGAAAGPILWQLPPSLVFDAPLLDDFLSMLPRDVAAAQRLAAKHDERFAGPGRASLALGAGLSPGTPLRFALEPRHPSFATSAFLRLCERHGVAAVAADTGGRHVELRALASPLAYARLHGGPVLYTSRYQDDELDAWAERVAGWARAGAREIYLFFDNDAAGNAFHDALRLRQRLAAIGLAAPAAIAAMAEPPRADR